MPNLLERIFLIVVKPSPILLEIRESQKRIEAEQEALGRKVDALASQLQDIIDILNPGPATGFVFTLFLEDGTTQTGATMATIRDDQNLPVSIQPVDKKGKPAQLDGVPTWASSDETVATVAPAADGLSAVISGVAPGSGRVVVTGDADLGSGTSPITGTLDITVTAGGAVSINIVEGTPVDQ